jgi:hypothetical protein
LDELIDHLPADLGSERRSPRLDVLVDLNLEGVQEATQPAGGEGVQIDLRLWQMLQQPQIILLGRRRRGLVLPSLFG